MKLDFLLCFHRDVDKILSTSLTFQIIPVLLLYFNNPFPHLETFEGLCSRQLFNRDQRSKPFDFQVSISANYWRNFYNNISQASEFLIPHRGERIEGLFIVKRAGFPQITITIIFIIAYRQYRETFWVF